MQSPRGAVAARPRAAAEPCVDQAAALVAEEGLARPVMIDCSHGNSRKIHTNQPLVAADLGGRVGAAEVDEHVALER